MAAKEMSSNEVRTGLGDEKPSKMKSNDDMSDDESSDEKPMETSTGKVPPTPNTPSMESGTADARIVKEKAIADAEFNYLQGWKLHVITFALFLVLFLTNLEILIVSTSLVGITTSIGGFDKSSWIVTAYLLTYIGFLIISAKLSDILGRKTTLCAALTMFIVFSAACGAAQTMMQLIILRALQGMGGSGIYAVGLVIVFELVPKTSWPAYGGLMSGVFSLSLLLGPLLGGAINNGHAWRWVFLLNVPIAGLGLLLLLVFLPNSFPRQGLASLPRSVSAFRRIDFVGTVLLLIATVFLVAGLEEAGMGLAWNSPFIVTALVVSSVTWFVFAYWSRRLTLANGAREPIFPWRFFQSRIWIGALLCAFFVGPPSTVAIFSIPQRYQVVNEMSPLEAGINLLPLTVASPIGSMAAAMVAGKAKVPPLYLVIGAAILQIIGFSLLTTISDSKTVSAAQYGYEWIAGFGTGINIGTLIIMAPHLAPEQDRAVAVGSINQIRYMGGAMALAITATVLNGHVESILRTFLSPQQIATTLGSGSIPDTVNEHVREQIRLAFASGYTLQMKILAGITAGQLPAALLMLQKKQLKI